MTIPKPPSKPWRVHGPNPLHEDFRYQPAAYLAVKELADWGHTATVYHWEGGDWRLYERIEPREADTRKTGEPK